MSQRVPLPLQKNATLCSHRHCFGVHGVFNTMFSIQSIVPAHSLPSNYLSEIKFLRGTLGQYLYVPDWFNHVARDFVCRKCLSIYLIFFIAGRKEQRWKTTWRERRNHFPTSRSDAKKKQRVDKTFARRLYPSASFLMYSLMVRRFISNTMSYSVLNGDVKTNQVHKVTHRLTLDELFYTRIFCRHERCDSSCKHINGSYPSPKPLIQLPRSTRVVEYENRGCSH